MNLVEHAQVNDLSYGQMIEILKGYKELKKKVLQLEFEIANYQGLVSGEDIIDSMNFRDTSIEDDKSGHACNTAKIAISYAKKAASVNMKHKQELENELRLLRVDKERLEYYLGLLEDKHGKVLRMIYIEGKTILETAEGMNFSDTTVKKIRKAGVIRLLEMYGRIIL